VMTLLQEIKKLFGPLLADVDCVSAVKGAMELQEEEGGRRGGSCKFLKAKRALWQMRLLRCSCLGEQQTSRNDFIANFLKSLIIALIRFFGVNSRY
jgi:hypothetical protein